MQLSRGTYVAEADYAERDTSPPQGQDLHSAQDSGRHKLQCSAGEDVCRHQGSSNVVEQGLATRCGLPLHAADEGACEVSFVRHVRSGGQHMQGGDGSFVVPTQDDLRGVRGQAAQSQAVL